MKRISLVLFLASAALVQAAWAAKPAAPQNNFRFVVLGDRTNTPNQKAFEMVLKDIERLHPDLVVTVGDLIEGYKDSTGAVKDWDATLPYLKLISCPVYLTPGNHDITTPDVRSVFIKKTGRNPYYSFDYQNSHFIILDNTLVEKAEEMAPDQMKWLEKDLKALKNKTGIYVFMHKPFWAEGAGAGKPDKLHDLFKKYKVTAVFTGHWHQYASDVIDGIRYVVMGSSGAEMGVPENPSLAEFYQFLWVTAKGDKFQPALVQAGCTYDPDWVSLKEETFAHGLLGKALFLTTPPIIEGKTPKELGGELKIVNLTDKPIQGEVDWKTGPNWQVLTPKTKATIAPRETLKAAFKFKGPGILYPLPVLKFAYPFGRDKVENLEQTLAVAKVVECPKAKKAPVVDGKFEANEWLGAAKASEFCGWDGNPATSDPTEVYFTYDGENLYIAAVCHDTAVSKLKAAITARDGEVFNDDCIGFLFSANQDTIYQIYLNPAAVIWDQFIDVPKDKSDPKWNGNFQVKCDRKDGQWLAEFKVPLKDLGVSKLDKATQIMMNIRRKQYSNNQSAFWINDWSHAPQNYGILKFK
jgi:hypothetical protein